VFEIKGRKGSPTRQIEMLAKPGVTKESDENALLQWGKNIGVYFAVYRLSAYSQRALMWGGSRSWSKLC
jgi:hypothetical protein